jgi:hypothetical protein
MQARQQQERDKARREQELADQQAHGAGRGGIPPPKPPPAPLPFVKPGSAREPLVPKQPSQSNTGKQGAGPALPQQLAPTKRSRMQLGGGTAQRPAPVRAPADGQPPSTQQQRQAGRPCNIKKRVERDARGSQENTSPNHKSPDYKKVRGT